MSVCICVECRRGVCVCLCVYIVWCVCGVYVGCVYGVGSLGVVECMCTMYHVVWVGSYCTVCICVRRISVCSVCGGLWVPV